MPGAVVLVTLTNPSEKVWGFLLELKPEGIKISGSSIDAFEDLIRQARLNEALDDKTVSVFFPMHRVERIERRGAEALMDSFSSRFREAVGVTVQEYIRAHKDRHNS
ncbi:MAG: hypothetical protein ACRD2B_11250 [Terriglobia bacterium]